MQPIDIRPDHLRLVLDILQQHVPMAEVWAFGSRAKWLARDTSDLDLCIRDATSLSFEQMGLLREAFEESNLPYKVDVVDWATISASFRKVVERDKVVVQEAKAGRVMAGEWTPTTLSKVLSFSNGKSSPDRADNLPFPVYGSNGIIGFASETNAKPNTLVIGRVGSYCGSLYFSKENCWVTDNAIRASAIDDNDAKFLLYLLQTLALNHWRAGSGQPLLNQTILGAIPTSIPPPDEQRAIAHILGTLDDKIELNRRMNETLEAIARAIFKSWFVDFDPVRAKASGEPPESICRRLGLTPDLLALFPDRFVDSELGEIPEGWGVESLEQLTCYLNRGLSPKYVEEGGVLVLNQKCVRGGYVDASKGRRHDPVQRKVEGRILEIGDILVNSTGVGTLGRVAQVLVIDEPTIVDSHITVVRSAPEKVSWNYLGITMLERQSEIEALGEGSTGQTELSRVRLGALRMLLPPKPLRDHFDGCVTGLRQRAMSNNVQSVMIAMTRDALLPKLLSGELRVPVAGAA